MGSNPTNSKIILSDVVSISFNRLHGLSMWKWKRNPQFIGFTETSFTVALPLEPSDGLPPLRECARELLVWPQQVPLETPAEVYFKDFASYFGVLKRNPTIVSSEMFLARYLRLIDPTLLMFFSNAIA